MSSVSVCHRLQARHMFNCLTAIFNPLWCTDNDGDAIVCCSIVRLFSSDRKRVENSLENCRLPYSRVNIRIIIVIWWRWWWLLILVRVGGRCPWGLLKEGLLHILWKGFFPHADLPLHPSSSFILFRRCISLMCFVQNDSQCTEGWNEKENLCVTKFSLVNIRGLTRSPIKDWIIF